MLKLTFAAAALALTFAQPAFAQDAMKPDAMKPDAMKTDSMRAATPMKCDDASMMKVETEVDAMAGDAMQKEEAMKQVGMAKEAMSANKPDECAMHLQEAGKSAMGKM